MKIGYVSTNRSLCKADSTVRLDHLEKVKETSERNLNCLKRILSWNIDHDILFFRISSNTVPFASHPRMTLDWRNELRDQLRSVGDIIRGRIRISMHPGQYVVLNSHKREVVESSIAELKYHADLLDSMGVDGHIQIHVGSSQGGKREGKLRFQENFYLLPENVMKRLAIENDDRVYTVGDCLDLWDVLGTPVVFDNLHHDLNNNGESLEDALKKVRITWKGSRPMTDYSSQEKGDRPGVHASTLSVSHFLDYVKRVDDIDMMLEIKDKEKSALKAVEILREIGKLD
ncbi:UV DNA damage repair endonuclease UvsE [Sulfuracidifex metallicus]|uniref:UV DNA damage repair endonuclease UvsE n=1 Tax=Sulfuracidifex metallicus TaxID=47303 RepID=UPI002272B268|nr:UV DNA damage repair endonuclease UvsE [Sulfuracidifex metallicus]MCY0850054.1 UV DNA damage repair endonuclease UvsE [Sulfuracidifex metallicus]